MYMKREFSEPELAEFSPQMLGVRAHKVTSESIKKCATELVDEAIRWGRGSGNKKADIRQIETQITEVAETHEIMEDRLARAEGDFLVAKRDAGRAAKNPLITPEMIDQKMRELDCDVSEAFINVADTNNGLVQYGLNEVHRVSAGINLPQEDQEGQ
jgi:hypothetical protein